MRFYQFIDEHNIKEYTKKYVIVDDRQISHPSAETLLEAGIKPLAVEELPLYNEETQYAEHYYVDEDTEITQKWRIVDIPEEVIYDEVTNA
jgi:hypothetical protein